MIRLEYIDFPILCYKLYTNIGHYDSSNHHFNELIYIKNGRGMHIINEKERLPYKSGNLIIIPNRQKHGFFIEEATEVVVIRFTEDAKLLIDDLIENLNSKSSYLERVININNHIVFFSNNDLLIIDNILEVMMLLSRDPFDNRNLLSYHLLSLFTIIERNTKYPKPVPHIKTKNIAEILNYIHVNINNTDKLKLSLISEQFNMSNSSLSTFFKREVGLPVKKYIHHSRMKIIEQKLLSGNFLIGEIAFMYGFVDDSHFSKSFKAYFGENPSQYIKNKTPKI
ncbi:helix-turn-helix transcriptional regulator [Elizabethkingia anophelis]|nr:helix-turn-helix transcriptional regulator [Elizabethkingia anophelis]MCT4062930.1 helix-turn-helix transcriptional regulator [Elizabethkingia anophelis]MCT4109221.1 helix-turn-helix transcriptional regulator [Elizabethkingia anophelis]